MKLVVSLRVSIVVALQIVAELVDLNSVCSTLLDAATSVIPPAFLYGRYLAVGFETLQKHMDEFDLEQMSTVCPVTVATAFNNRAVVLWLDIRHSGKHLHPSQSVFEFLNRAKLVDPWSIVIRRNLAWLVHATTVAREHIDKEYNPVMDLAILHYALALNASKRSVEYSELQAQLLAPLRIQWINRSGGQVRFRWEVLGIAFAFAIINTRPGHAQLQIIAFKSAQCEDIRDMSETCLVNMQENHFLDPREGQISVLEVYGDLCKDPMGSNKHLRLLSEVLIGLHDSTTTRRKHTELREYELPSYEYGRAKFVKSKRWAIGSSILEASNLATTVNVDMIGLTFATRGRLNFMRLAVEATVARRIPGDLLEAGVWRGGMSMWIRAVLNELRSERRIWVADSFVGVPPSVDSNRFASDMWLEMPPFLYAVSLEEVRASFEMFGLIENETDESVRFLPGFFNYSFKQLPASMRLSLVHVDADTYESTSDVLDAILPLLSPGGVLVFDDWHLNGVRKAALERHLGGPLLPIPEDYVYGCRQGTSHGELEPHTMPNKVPQSAYVVIGSY